MVEDDESRISKAVAGTSNQGVEVSETCKQNHELVVVNDEQDTKDDVEDESAMRKRIVNSSWPKPDCIIDAPNSTLSDREESTSL